PLVGALLIVLQSAVAKYDGTLAAAPSARWIALITFLVEFVVSLGMWWAFDLSTAAWQFRVTHWWISGWGANFDVGIDGISLSMVLLTTFLMPLSVLGGWTSVREKVRSYYALLLILTTGMIGVFLALDLLFFYVMWEVMLIPMYFIIGIWGGERRIYASVKFFIYTFLGSLLMLVAILYVGFHVGGRAGAGGPPDFSYPDLLARLSVSPGTARWLFGAFFLALAVKVPMFPFH